MTAGLLFLMAFQITGEALHEWIGAGMLILFLLHNILNVRWYGNLLATRNIVLRIGAAAIALYGAVCFINADIPAYMLLRTEFAFFDYDKSTVQVFVEYIAMMGLWVWVSYYASKMLIRISAHK